MIEEKKMQEKRRREKTLSPTSPFIIIEKKRGEIQNDIPVICRSTQGVNEYCT